jgi:hypothetical protein
MAFSLAYRIVVTILIHCSKRYVAGLVHKTHVTFWNVSAPQMF